VRKHLVLDTLDNIVPKLLHDYLYMKITVYLLKGLNGRSSALCSNICLNFMFSSNKMILC